MNLNLPTCTERATNRFELFSPANGRLCGSLDAVVHTCDTHAQAARDAGEANGMSAWAVYSDTTDYGTCGRVVDFRALLGIKEEQ